MPEGLGLDVAGIGSVVHNVMYLEALAAGISPKRYNWTPGLGDVFSLTYVHLTGEPVDLDSRQNNGVGISACVFD